MVAKTTELMALKVSFTAYSKYIRLIVKVNDVNTMVAQTNIVFCFHEVTLHSTHTYYKLT